MRDNVIKFISILLTSRSLMVKREKSTETDHHDHDYHEMTCKREGNEISVFLWFLVTLLASCVFFLFVRGKMGKWI